MKYIKYELAEMEERKNLLINQLDIFTKKHKFNKNDYLEKFLKEEVENFVQYGLNLPFHCVSVDPGLKFISRIEIR